MLFASSCVQMWEVGHKEGWAPNNWCFWTVVLDKTLESSFDSKKIKPVNPKGNQLWLFTGRTDAEAPICRPPDWKNWLIGKDPDAGKDGAGRRIRGWQDEMVGWHHWLNECEFKQTEIVKDREAWRAAVHRVAKSDTTEWLNKTKSPGLALPGNLFEMQILGSQSAAAAAKSLQSCPTLFDPIDGSPPGSPVPGILQARTLEWVAISFSNAWKWKVKVKLLSRVQLSDPMDCGLPGSSIHGIFQARVLEWGAIAFSVGPTLDIVNQKLWVGLSSMCFNKCTRWFWFTLSLKNTTLVSISGPIIREPDSKYFRLWQQWNFLHYSTLLLQHKRL